MYVTWTNCIFMRATQLIRVVTVTVQCKWHSLGGGGVLMAIFSRLTIQFYNYFCCSVRGRSWGNGMARKLGVRISRGIIFVPMFQAWTKRGSAWVLPPMEIGCSNICPEVPAPHILKHATSVFGNLQRDSSKCAIPLQPPPPKWNSIQNLMPFLFLMWEGIPLLSPLHLLVHCSWAFRLYSPVVLFWKLQQTLTAGFLQRNKMLIADLTERVQRRLRTAIWQFRRGWGS